MGTTDTCQQSQTEMESKLLVIFHTMPEVTSCTITTVMIAMAPGAFKSLSSETYSIIIVKHMTIETEMITHNGLMQPFCFYDA